MNGLMVALGGALGAWLRYMTIIAIPTTLSSYPYATLLVNILGSLILGIMTAASEHWGFLSDTARLFLVVGILGSYTTLSTLSLDVFRMIEQHHWSTALSYIACSFIGGTIAIMIGYYGIRLWIK